MKLSLLNLTPRLSKISYFFIEIFFLMAIVFIPYSKTMTEIGIITSLILWILRKWPWNEDFPKIQPYFLCYFVFIVSMFLSFIPMQNDLYMNGFHGLWKWLKYIGLFFMCYELFQRNGAIMRFMILFLGCVWFAVINGYYQLYSGEDFFKHYSINIPGRFKRITSSFSAPSGLASVLSIALPIYFFIVIRAKRWFPRILVSLMTLTIFVCFVLTLSRGAFLALFISISVYLLFRGRKTWLLPLWSVPLLMIILSEKMRYNFLTSLNLKDITVGERLSYWKTTWDMIMESPIIGLGVNTYYEMFAQFAPPDDAYRGYAHNCYLQMWSEIGILGLIAFLIPLFFFTLLYLFKSRSIHSHFELKDALWIGVSAFLLHSFVDTLFYSLQPATTFWIMWGLLVSLNTPQIKNQISNIKNTD